MQKINVTRSSMPPFEEYINEIKDLWESHWLTNMGQKHAELQRRLCDYLSVSNVSLFTNGHLALEAAIAAMDLKGEVITTPFTFASTTQAIVRCGLTPVFCDIDPENYTLDPSKIEPLITEKTCAIVPVHVYGNVCDVHAIQKIADQYGLKVIYDAAHAFGVRIGDKGIASFGDASMFSFHATKVFNTIEGGCVAYSDETFTAKLRMQKNFGMADSEHYPEIAGNAKMSEFQAAMGLCNLRHVDEEIAKRKKVAQRYTEQLAGIPGLKLNQPQEQVISNWAYYPVLFDEKVLGISRNQVAENLMQSGIYARKYFYPLTNEFECYRDLFKIQDTPIAKKASEQVLTLPLYADLALEDVDRICDLILREITI